MKKGNRALTAGLLAIILAVTYTGCGGSKGKQPSTAGISSNSADTAKKAVIPAGISDPADILKDIVKTAGVIVWEKEITETPVDRVPGNIARKKSNLKITGPITPEQLKAIGDALRSAEEKTGTQLFRLDMSEVTGLTELPFKCFEANWFPGNGNLGSLILPEGLKKIENVVFGGQNSLVELHLPDSLEYIGAGGISSSLSKLVIPAKCALAPYNAAYGGELLKRYLRDRASSEEKEKIKKYGFSTGSIFYSQVESTVVFKDGYELINLGSVNSYRIILPPSISEFYIIAGFHDDKAPEGLAELYCYAVNPPAWCITQDGNPSLPLEYVKTIYVPAGSVKAYEDAWFTYTTAEFKAIPANMATIDKWY